MIHETSLISKPMIELAPDTQVEETGYTYLHCVYTTSPKYSFGWWINIYKTSYLISRQTGETLCMLDAINIPLAPKRHYLRKFGDSLHFVLVFPQIPKHWSRFDFIERCDGEIGLKALNIVRNNIGVYKVSVS